MMDKSTNPVSYVGPMSEEDYLAVVERIQQAMAIEPFRPPLIDVVKLLSDWRDLSNQNERLKTTINDLVALIKNVDADANNVQLDIAQVLRRHRLDA
jgi:hypothetical protein